MPPALLSCRDIECHRPLWHEGPSHLHGISARFEAAQFHAVVGPEGCGKRLLLHLLGLLERPDRGAILFDGADATAAGDEERDLLRQRNFGLILPAGALLPSLSVLENLALPVLKSACFSGPEQAELTLAALRFCGLEGEADRAAGDLDAAHAARAGFARAVVHRPRVLIAESPAAEDILAPLARRAVDEWGLTVLWGGAPDGPAACAADRVLALDQGRLAVPAE